MVPPQGGNLTRSGFFHERHDSVAWFGWPPPLVIVVVRQTGLMKRKFVVSPTNETKLLL